MQVHGKFDWLRTIANILASDYYCYSLASFALGEHFPEAQTATNASSHTIVKCLSMKPTVEIE